MGFHNDNRQLPNPGSSLAASNLRQDLERIHSKTGIAARCGYAAEEALAWNRYNRSVRNSNSVIDNMAQGGNGRSRVPRSSGNGFAPNDYDDSQSGGLPIMPIFWLGVIWIAIYKAGLQPLALKILGAIWGFIVAMAPVISKILYFFADLLTDLIKLIFHMH